jgi:hypothetical protein
VRKHAFDPAIKMIWQACRKHRLLFAGSEVLLQYFFDLGYC